MPIDLYLHPSAPVDGDGSQDRPFRTTTQLVLACIVRETALVNIIAWILDLNRYMRIGA